MPVFHKGAYRPRKHKNDPGRAPKNMNYDGGAIPTTLPKFLRESAKLQIGKPQKPFTESA
jgi:hypothetical protein